MGSIRFVSCGLFVVVAVVSHQQLRGDLNLVVVVEGSLLVVLRASPADTSTVTRLAAPASRGTKPLSLCSSMISWEKAMISRKHDI